MSVEGLLVEVDDGLTCKPIDNFEDIFEFVKNPPAWRSLCTGLTPHSEYLIRNMDVNKHVEDISLAKPDTFCHFDPDTPEVHRFEERKLPKTLVCHDMANGYHDDCKIQGSSAYDAYTFYNWAGVDVFCYFSHHLLTVPPLAWINVAHMHGVRVIGTLITEWAEGAEFWDVVLASDATAHDTASALVAIAKALKFEGWLLNVENKIKQPDRLVRFVALLHRLLHAELGAGATLLWYDSVTVDGHLNWQNGLNDKNKAFFDVCDGLFTNYSWAEGDLSASAAAAGARRADLLVGVDVWGRNFYGGGQFNTQEAVKLIHRYGCSMAIFAPAWTHEAIAEDGDGEGAILMGEELDKLQRFLLRDRALWDSLWPFLNTRVPSALPFQSSFCRGQGTRRRVCGEVYSPGPWYNLRHQQYQPNALHGPHGYLLSPRRSPPARRPAHPARPAEDTVRKLSLDKAVEAEVTAHADEATATLDRPCSRSRLQRLMRWFFRRQRDAIQEPAGAAKPGGGAEPGGAAEPCAGPPPGRSSLGLRAAEECRLSLVRVSVSLRLGRAGARLVLAHVPHERACLEHHYGDSFTGGSCLQVNPWEESSCGPRSVRLLWCDFRAAAGALLACVVTKTLPAHRRQALDVTLAGTDEHRMEFKVTLVGSEEEAGAEAGAEAEAGEKKGAEAGVEAAGGETRVSALRGDGRAFREVQRYLLLHEPGFYVPVGNAFGWTVRYYSVPCGAVRVTSVRVRAALPDGPLLLGHFGLCARDDAHSSSGEYL